MWPLGGAKICMAAYGEKGLSYLLRPKKRNDFIWIWQYTCAATMCANFRKIATLKISLPILVMQNFRKIVMKWARGAISKFCLRRLRHWPFQ